MRQIELSDMDIDDIRNIKPGSKVIVTTAVTGRMVPNRDNRSFTLKIAHEIGEVLTVDTIDIEEDVDDDEEPTGDYTVYVYCVNAENAIRDGYLALIIGPVNYKGNVYEEFTCTHSRRT